MPESLTEFLDKKIAEDLDVQPEQVTTDFIHEMRKRIYRDPQFQFDRSTRYLSDPTVSFPTAAEQRRWNLKCRAWAQEVLRQDVTSCAEEAR
jgi:hypothetical protein